MRTYKCHYIASWQILPSSELLKLSWMYLNHWTTTGRKCLIELADPLYLMINRIFSSNTATCAILRRTMSDVWCGADICPTISCTPFTLCKRHVTTVNQSENVCVCAHNTVWRQTRDVCLSFVVYWKVYDMLLIIPIMYALLVLLEGLSRRADRQRGVGSAWIT